MNHSPNEPPPSVAEAEGKLATLGVQIDAMQSVLVGLLQDVVRAESRLNRTRADQIVEVNQQLVVAALAGQADADTAVQALKDASELTVLDVLTRLPNRTAFVGRFLHVIANAKRRGTRFALLFVDLDGFKQINDVHGHSLGDKALVLAASRISSVVREVDTVSRHGGDEFVILLAEPTQPKEAQAVAEKLIASLGVPAKVGGTPVSLSASIGIAMYPSDGEDIETLVAHADEAMYQTKRQRPGGVAFFKKAPAAIDSSTPGQTLHDKPSGPGSAGVLDQ